MNEAIPKPVQALITLPPEVHSSLVQITLDVSAKAGRRVKQKDVIADLLAYAVLFPDKVQFSSLMGVDS